MPVEPPPSPYTFDTSSLPAGEDLVGLGGELDPGTLLAAYRQGLFPMGVGEAGSPPLGWWSPDPRGVLLPGGLRVSKSLRKAARNFEVRIDTAFTEVINACADPARPGAWITEAIKGAYVELHQLGWAHSVESWQDGKLVGGLYGVAVGGLFAGESMFHHARDASKVALVGLVEHLENAGHRSWMVDTQWQTPHLASLGVIEVERADYQELLGAVVHGPDRWVSTRTRHAAPDIS